MDISRYLTPTAVAVRAGASTKRQVVQQLADLAEGETGVPSEVLHALLWEREQAGSTGVGSGAAIPHARTPLVREVTGVFLKLDHPVDFDALDQRPVDLVFGLLAPADAAADHLQALAAVSRFLRRSDIRQRLRQAETSESLFALLVQPVTADAA